MGRRETPVRISHPENGPPLLCLTDCIQAFGVAVSAVGYVLKSLQKAYFGSPGTPFYGSVVQVQHIVGTGHRLTMAPRKAVLGIFNLYWDNRSAMKKTAMTGMQGLLAELRSHIALVSYTIFWCL